MHMRLGKYVVLFRYQGTFKDKAITFTFGET